MTDNALRQQSIYDILRRSAARHPQKLAIRQHGVGWTYAEFHHLCRAAAAGLAARHR
jgi:fatty-acyl-CoA synthase